MALTMSAAVDGRLTVHPWLLADLGESDTGSSILDQDVFSLIVARSKARGLASFSGAEPPSVRWGHNDAGGDWIQDGTVRRLAWFQCAVPEQPTPGRRLPIQPVLSVLDEVLALVGVVEPTALHLIVPLAGAPDGRPDLAALARWFDLADPETACQLTLILAAPVIGSTSLRSVPELIRTRSMDRISIEQTEPLVVEPYGTPWLLDPVEHRQLAWRATLPTWSIEAAGWLIELLLEALRELAVTAPVAISVVAGAD